MANAGIVELSDYFRDAIARRRREPGNDLISGLIAAEDQGTVLSEDEMLATCILLLVAGHETTTNLIGNGLLALLRTPEAKAAFLAKKANLRAAIDELLRFDSPVQLTGRLTSEPVVFGGVPIDVGTGVDIWLGAANRDPDRFLYLRYRRYRPGPTAHMALVLPNIHFASAPRHASERTLLMHPP